MATDPTVWVLNFWLENGMAKFGSFVEKTLQQVP